MRAGLILPFFALLILAVLSASLAHADVVIESVSPGTVAAGCPVVVEVSVSCEVNAPSAKITGAGASGTDLGISLVLDSTTGRWRGTNTVPANAVAGAYVVVASNSGCSGDTESVTITTLTGSVLTTDLATAPYTCPNTEIIFTTVWVSTPSTACLDWSNIMPDSIGGLTARRTWTNAEASGDYVITASISGSSPSISQSATITFVDPTISGTLNPTRGANTSYSVDTPPSGFTANWTFNDGTRTIPTSGPHVASSWAGNMVVNGTISVTVQNGTGAGSFSCSDSKSITITPRTWNPETYQDITDEGNGQLPPNPDAPRELGVSKPDLNANLSGSAVPAGPNTGYFFLNSGTVVYPWKAYINADISDSSSLFYRAQSTPSSTYLTPAQTLENVRLHEGTIQEAGYHSH